MSRDEHWRWFRLIVAFILWTMICGLAGAFLLPRAKGAPLPFTHYSAPWLPDPVGEYEYVTRSNVTGERVVARVVLGRGGDARYVWLHAPLSEYDGLKWHRERDEILITRDGITRYWLYRGVKIRRIK